VPLVALEMLPRVWQFPELPGYREPAHDYGTYFASDYSALPPVARELDDEFGWLRAEPAVLGSLTDADYSQVPQRPASADELAALIGKSGVTPPRSFATFVADGQLHARIRSCTACYLDLADVIVPTEDGGWLIHFLSDSQWVLHWLLYVGPESGEAVVVTQLPFGLQLDEAPTRFDPANVDAWVCAASFSEFVYRFWIENEIWYRLSRAGSNTEPPLSVEQQAYVDHYRADPRKHDRKYRRSLPRNASA
jgi:hypothetical protein